MTWELRKIGGSGRLCLLLLLAVLCSGVLRPPRHRRCRRLYRVRSASGHGPEGSAGI